MSRIEQLAAANLKPANLSPMEEWDKAVAERANRDQCPRDAAVDRLLATVWGSSLWNRAASWDARQPKVVIENRRQVRTGNWGSSNPATLRRIPRRP